MTHRHEPEFLFNFEQGFIPHSKDSTKKSHLPKKVAFD